MWDVLISGSQGIGCVHDDFMCDAWMLAHDGGETCF